MKILVTGFEPFGGAVINPAYEAVKLLPDVIAGAEVIKIEIPTVFGRDEEVVRAAVEKHHPDAVLQQLSLFLMQDFVPNMQDRPEISLHQFQQALL